MNGSDHLLPDAHVEEVAAALATSTGWSVRRGLLEDFVAGFPPEDEQPRWTGDLLGGRVANLLPGVWSTRTWIKVRNRRAETALTAEAEPWAALGGALGAGDERPSLRLAWRSLLPNQAHDSICGCSVDAVHRQMTARFEAATELAEETSSRLLERLAGLGTERRVPWSDGFDIAVFNPSPRSRTDVVRFPLDGFPLYGIKPDGTADVHPVALASLLQAGYSVDGEAARLVRVADTDRVRMVPEQSPGDVEFVAADVPAFGWKRFALAPAPEVADEVDDGRRIEVAGPDGRPVVAEVEPGGTLAVTLGGRSWSGLCGLEDLGDAGDTYDADLLGDGSVSVRVDGVERRRHPSGLQGLTVRLVLSAPVGLAAPGADGARPRAVAARAEEQVESPVELEVRLVPGVARVDLRVAVDNRADDHRLRLLFPTGGPVETSRSATTFGVAERPVGALDASKWVHAAVPTFPNQGWVAAGGLAVVAPGLVETEVTAEGVVALTLLRSVAYLSRMWLHSRPNPAGPGLATPEAQCPGPFEARMALLGEADALAGGATAAEVGLRAVPVGPEPLVADGVSLLTVAPAEVVLSALKPAEDGDGVVLRLLNPTAATVRATVGLGFPVAGVEAVRLDEEPASGGPGDAAWALDGDGRTLVVELGPHALRSARLRP